MPREQTPGYSLSARAHIQPTALNAYSQDIRGNGRTETFWRNAMTAARTRTGFHSSFVCPFVKAKIDERLPPYGLMGRKFDGRAISSRTAGFKSQGRTRRPKFRSIFRSPDPPPGTAVLLPWRFSGISCCIKEPAQRIQRKPASPRLVTAGIRESDERIPEKFLDKI